MRRAGQDSDRFLAVLQSQVLGKVYGHWELTDLPLLPISTPSLGTLTTKWEERDGKAHVVAVAAYARRSTGAQSCRCQLDLRREAEVSTIYVAEVQYIGLVVLQARDNNGADLCLRHPSYTPASSSTMVRMAKWLARCRPCYIFSLTLSVPTYDRQS